MKTQRKAREHTDLYHKFSEIDGSHPLKTLNPASVVEYQARQRAGGHVVYFNFTLAKSMGLIPADHAGKLSKTLEKRILDTFSLVIINEYDLINQTPVNSKDILPNTYMATRYLQLQHPNKQGKTSGDGRSIWNGYVQHQGHQWDISSCGTGATKLSPATSIYKKFFQTGDPAVSYGCGYSELDEGLSTLFMSEVLHENSIKTERVLAIIQFKNGYTINVRAHQNLLRPSHFFMYVKQNRLNPLKRLTDYYIEREVAEGRLEKAATKKKQYRLFLEKISHTFAELAAKMEDEYIFCWLDWDGDNILMDGSIIDYGSLRQFGLFHHEYRYDDVQRYSTSIKEQKEKARHTVQTFAQIYEYLISAEKHRLDSFTHHWAVELYNEKFDYYKNRNLLFKIGFTEQQIDYLLHYHKTTVLRFRKDFSYFERCKSEVGLHEVADGINHSAIFCMRDILRELPQLHLLGHETLSNAEFIEIIKSTYATENDLKVSSYRQRKIKSFQKNYWHMIDALCKKMRVDRETILSNISTRTSVINKYGRITGNSICHIVNRVIKHKPKLSPEDIHRLNAYLIQYQHLNPDKKLKPIKLSPKLKLLFMQFVSLIKNNREGL